MYANQANPDGAPKPVSEIPGQIDGLREDLGDLSRAIATLTSRLEPVRRTPVPMDAIGNSRMGNVPQAVQRAAQTPIGTQLAEMRKDVQNQLSTVAAALHELELP